MPPKAPRQHRWTLRFKNNRITTIILVQPLQPFESIKEELLSAIKATGRTDINGAILPSDANDIIFGVPVDKNDPDRGWKELEMPLAEGGKVNQNPTSAGLKDGAMLAFRFDGSEGDWDVIMPSYDEEETLESQERI